MIAINEKKLYASVGIIAVIILLLVGGFVKSCNNMKMIKMEHAEKIKAMEEPAVIVKPKIIREIEIVRVPAPGETEYVEVSTLDGTADEIMKNLKKRGVGTWIKLREVIEGGSESIPTIPGSSNYIDRITRNNWHLIGSYNITDKALGFGLTRRVYRSLEVGFEYGLNEDIELKVLLGF